MATASKSTKKASTPTGERFTKATYLKWYREMLLMRKFEEFLGYQDVHIPNLDRTNSTDALSMLDQSFRFFSIHCSSHFSSLSHRPVFLFAFILVCIIASSFFFNSMWLTSMHSFHSTLAYFEHHLLNE
jgi:hypothetical protein